MVPAYEISTFPFIHVYYLSLLLSVPVKSGHAYCSVLANPHPTAQGPLYKVSQYCPFFFLTVFCRFQMTMQRPRGSPALGRASGGPTFHGPGLGGGGTQKWL